MGTSEARSESGLAVVSGASGITRPELVEAVRGFMATATADNTRRAYRSQWATFSEWCQRRGVGFLPAAPETVCLYLAERAQGGAKVATLTQALSAISKAHETAGHPSPRAAVEVRTLMRGIRRQLGTAQAQKEPLVVNALRAVVAGLPFGTAGTRDRALLLLGFTGAFRRSELASLRIEDVTFDAEGLRVLLRRSKTDQDGKGTQVPIPFGDVPETCPVKAVRAWLELSRATEGPLFRPVTAAGRIRRRSLTPQAVAEVVKRHCAAAGLDPSKYGGHSLRSGFATSAAKAGKQERDIGRQTRHSPGSAVLRRYIRDVHLFEGCAAKGIGL